MSTYYLSIGSNINPEVHIPRCRETLRKELTVKKISTAYETDPVGPAGNKKFWNLAAAIEFSGQPKELARRIRVIEESLGRTRDPQNKFAPRTIDIDILPQPDFQNQAFIVLPLAEIAPKELDSVTGKTFEELARPLQKEARGFKPVGKF